MDDDNTHQTPDDALEDTRPDDQLFDPKTDEETLPGDYDSPASPPPSSLPLDYPATDDNLDEDEVYSEGLTEATDLDKTEVDSDDAPAQPLEP